MSSIYDDLANSDFVEPGKFKEQLRLLSQVQARNKGQEGQEDGYEDDYEEDEEVKSIAHSQADQARFLMHQKEDLGSDHNQQYDNGGTSAFVDQKLIIDQNPMDQENEDGNLVGSSAVNQRPRQISNKNQDSRLQKQENSQRIEQFIGQKQNYQKQQERDIKNNLNREQINDENLLQTQKLGAQNSSQNDLLQQRNKMIFDEDLELNDLHANALPEPNPRFQVLQEQLESQRAQNYTLNQKYAPEHQSKALKGYSVDPELENEMQTAHFNKQANYQGVPQQKKFEQIIEETSEGSKQREQQYFMREQEATGTGQFGGKQAPQQIDGFSPKIKQHSNDSHENDQISRLLLQLQAPITIDPLKNTGDDQKRMQQLDLQNAHGHIKESIKQMRIEGGIGVQEFDRGHISLIQNRNAFNGANSLYELAQRVGQPFSSSNQNSSILENENDFQKFINQGEGSMGSAQTNQFQNYQQQNMSNHLDWQNNLINEKFSRQEHPNGDSAHHLLLQMQDSSQSNGDRMKQGQSNQENMKTSDFNPYQNGYAEHNYFNGKENINGKNFHVDPSVLLRPDQQNYKPQGNQYQMVYLNQEVPSQAQNEPWGAKVQMSLAARGKLAVQNKQMPQTSYLTNEQRQYIYEDQDNSLSGMPQQLNNIKHGHIQGNPSFREVFNPKAQHQQSNNERFNPPQAPYQGQKSEFSKTNKNEKAEKRKALLAQFDDIPIHELHKADGYQIRNIDDQDPGAQTREEKPRNMPSKIGDSEQQKESEADVQNYKNLSLKDQVFHQNWKVRQSAFNQINQLFINYKRNEDPIQKEHEMYGDPDNPFDQYGPLLENMIKDSNLTAQYEGLTCFYSYVKLSKDIKSVVFFAAPYLIDKIQHTKPNLREITQRILHMMFLRKQNVIPEFLKRFKSKNPKVISFCLDLMSQFLMDRTACQLDVNLKLIFKATLGLLGHQIKDIRDQAIQIVSFVYENCEDDIDTFCSNLKGLRPVQLKEMRDHLGNLKKNEQQQYLVKIFDKITLLDNKREEEPDKSPRGARSKSTESNINRNDFRQNKGENEDEGAQIDLFNLLPENFNEIPYLNQITIKKKAMEQFNTELSKILQQSEPQIKLNKDYSQIYNIIVHMLEDANMLVFNEAIKAVEHLAILMKSSIKQSKMKQFIQLLADKYKETKTAVLSALEKAFFAVFENKCLPSTQFFDLLINQIAITHKNPRVKQLVIDRVEIIIQTYFLNDQHQCTNSMQLNQIFRIIKDKLKQIILKDNNASVRDSGVNLLASFRIILGTVGTFMDYQPVLDIVNLLPKQRISEITKKLELFQQQYQPQNNQNHQQSSEEQTQNGNEERDSGRFSQRQPEQLQQQQVADSSTQQMFDTKKAQAKVSAQYQSSLSDIILTIKNIGQEKDRLRYNQITQNLEQGIGELGDQGVSECKPHIVQCIFWLLSNFPAKINFQEPERQDAVKVLVAFMKKLYCIERSVSRNLINFAGESVELTQAISSSLLCFALLQDSQQKIIQLLNVIYVAAISTQGESTQSFIKTVKLAMRKFNPCPQRISNGKTMIISSTIYYIADKIEELVLKSQMCETLEEGIQLTDIEEFRSIAIQEMESIKDEFDKQILIQSLVYMKNKMNAHKQSQISNMQKVQDKVQTQSQYQSEEANAHQPVYVDQRDQLNAQKVREVPRHIEVIELIQENFEKGLIALKQLVKDEQSGEIEVSFDQKEKMISLLLKLTTQLQKNPQDQYKQAYSLKALMWLKEEFIGLEETFRLTNQIMDIFVTAILDGKDSSIEQYLLNFWTKELSLRDLVDRLQVTVRFQKQKQEAFKILFSWLYTTKIEAGSASSEQEKWVLEDFRKIAPFLAENGMEDQDDEDDENDNIPQRFISLIVKKFGAKKVRDFMEIQLIQENDILIKFLDVFDILYGLDKSKPKSKIKNGIMEGQQSKYEAELSQIAQQQQNLQNESRQSIGEPLLTTSRSGTLDETGGKRPAFLQELNDRRKERNRAKESQDQDFHSTLAEEKKKYEEIMQKLDKYKGQKSLGFENCDGEDRADEKIRIENVNNDIQKGFKRVSATSKGRNSGDQKDVDQVSRPVSGRYASNQDNAGTAKEVQNEENQTNSLEEFGDEQDYQLSTEQHQSIAHMTAGSSKLQLVGHPRQYNPKSCQSTTDFGDGLQGKNHRQYKNTSSAVDIASKAPFGDENQFQETDLQQSRQKLKQSEQNQEERILRLESSQIKVRQYKHEMDTLEQERKRVLAERDKLLSEQNQETEQWKLRYQQMTRKNDEIIANLAEANQCYLKQVAENEKLSQQIVVLQEQHKEFEQRYVQMQQKLRKTERQVEEQKIQIEESMISKQNKEKSPAKTMSRTGFHTIMVEEEQLQKISQVFNRSELLKYGEDRSEGQIGVKKIQGMLLNTDEFASETLCKPMIIYYQKLRSSQDRMQMICALKLSLDNEDILFAISTEVYKSMLNFLLRAFSFEKELIERSSILEQHEREQQNELTQESQRLVSKLLNSKEFTVSLVCLINLLKREAIPDDFYTDLSTQDKQYLRVLMRCISRITKALQSENPDLIRAFDVLLEMQKLFIKHPPENLRQDIPCLQDFDFVYRGLKDVSDKLIELQPQKCISFLEFCRTKENNQSSTQYTDESEQASQRQQQPNAFIKYIATMLQVKENYLY